MAASAYVQSSHQHSTSLFQVSLQQLRHYSSKVPAIIWLQTLVLRESLLNEKIQVPDMSLVCNNSMNMPSMIVQGFTAQAKEAL
jgi:hypothetical protein